MRTVATFASLSLILLAGATRAPAPPSIEGTYRFASRDMPDGSKLVPPAIDGVLTYANGYRNFNIYWKTPDGKAFSVSFAGTYQLSATQYTEKTIFFLVNDGIGGKGATYDLTGASGSGPVSVAGTRISIQLPLHGEPDLVFDGNTVTANAKGPFGAFTDHWVKVQ
jgi:hypothetical protein